MTAFTSALPNLPGDDVPVGADENDNVEIKRWGKFPLSISKSRITSILVPA